MSGPEDVAGSQTLERGLAVLRALGESASGLTTSEAADACGLHRSVIYRLLISLERTGFATRDSEGRYRPGPALTSLARAVPELREVVAPELERLADAVSATACLIEVRAGAAVTVLIAEPRINGPIFTYRLGNRDPLDRGAGGIASLASAPYATGEDERITRAREAGYVVTRGELNAGALGVAAPLPGWNVRAAIAVVSTRDDDADPMIAGVTEAVARLEHSRRLG